MLTRALHTTRWQQVRLLGGTLIKGWHLSYALAGLTGTIALLLALPASLTTPQLFSVPTVQTPTSAALAFVTAAIITATVQEPCEQLRYTLRPRRRYLGQIRVLALTAMAATAPALIAHSIAGPSVLLALTGEALITATITGVRYCWAVPMIHSVSAATLGANSLGELSKWAWFLNTEQTAVGLLTSVALFSAGLTATARFGVTPHASMGQV